MSTATPQAAKGAGGKTKSWEGGSSFRVGPKVDPNQYDEQRGPSFFHFVVKRNEDAGKASLNPEDPINLEKVINAWHHEKVEQVTNTTMKFVTTTAGFLGEPTDKLLLDEFGDLRAFMNSLKNKPFLKGVGIQKLDLAVLSALREIYEEDRKEDQDLELQKIWYLPGVVKDVYFSAELAAQCQKAIDDILQIMAGVPFAADELFVYLIRNDFWMQRFARLVAAGISQARRRKYVYGTKHQAAAVNQEYQEALQRFTTFSVKERIVKNKNELAAGTAPYKQYEEVYHLESVMPNLATTFRNELFAGTNI